MIQQYIKYFFLLSLVLLSGCCGLSDNDYYYSSFDEPIYIDAETDQEGISMEYDWLAVNACLDGGIYDVEQSLDNYNEAYYDILYVTCNNGDEEIYYFYIDDWFGVM